jgi:hypothetical protein
MIDYHVHLWRHAPGLQLQATVDQLAVYCAHAAHLGVSELAVTEHSSRFRQFDQLLRGWWENDPSPARRAEMSKSWDEELGADLDEYVEVALAAREAGLPVVVGWARVAGAGAGSLEWRPRRGLAEPRGRGLVDCCPLDQAPCPGSEARRACRRSPLVASTIQELLGEAS